MPDSNMISAIKCTSTKGFMCNHKQLCSEEMEYCKSKNKKEKITQKQQAMHKNADIILQRKITWVNPSIKSLN